MNAEAIGKLCDLEPTEETSWMGTPEENQKMTAIASELVNHLVEYLDSEGEPSIGQRLTIIEAAIVAYRDTFDRDSSLRETSPRLAVATFFDDVARAVDVPVKAVDMAWSLLVWSRD